MTVESVNLEVNDKNNVADLNKTFESTTLGLAPRCINSEVVIGGRRYSLHDSTETWMVMQPC